MSGIEALADSKVPATVKHAIQHTTENYNRTLIVNNINWTIFDYANGDPNQYIRRTDNDKLDSDRDKHQYFMGDRYLPDNGSSVIMIENDGQNGIWAVSSSGNVTRIEMRRISYK